MTTVPAFPGISSYDYRAAEEIRAGIREMPEIG
jgi:hypothetical protein